MRLKSKGGRQLECMGNPVSFFIIILRNVPSIYIIMLGEWNHGILPQSCKLLFIKLLIFFMA